MKQVNYSLSPHTRRCVRFYGGRWGVDNVRRLGAF